MIYTRCVVTSHIFVVDEKEDRWVNFNRTLCIENCEIHIRNEILHHLNLPPI